MAAWAHGSNDRHAGARPCRAGGVPPARLGDELAERARRAPVGGAASDLRGRAGRRGSIARLLLVAARLADRPAPRDRARARARGAGGVLGGGGPPGPPRALADSVPAGPG